MTLNRHDVIEWLAWPQCQTKIQRIRLCTLRPILYKLAVAFQKRKKGGRSINELIFYSLCAAIKVPSKMNVDQALRSAVAKTTCFFSFLELVRDRKGPSNLVYFILSISSKKNQTKKPFLLFHLLLTFSLTLYSKNPKKNDDHHHSTWLFQAPKRETQFFFFLTSSFSLRVFVFMCWIKPDDGREGTKWLILKQGPLIVVLSTWGRADAALNIITDWVIVADAPPLPPHSTDIHTHTQHTHPSYTHTHPIAGRGVEGEENNLRQSNHHSIIY